MTQSEREPVTYADLVRVYWLICKTENMKRVPWKKKPTTRRRRKRG